VVDLAVLDVDLGVELEVQLVGALQGVGEAAEGETGGLQVQLEVLLLDVGYGDGEVDIVLCGVGLIGALGPEDY